MNLELVQENSSKKVEACTEQAQSPEATIVCALPPAARHILCGFKPEI
jgi:hypothetical protein